MWVKFRKFLVFLGALTLFVSFVSPVLAQIGGTAEDIGWSPGIYVIAAGEPEGHIPQIIADKAGRVHIFWCSWVGDVEDSPFEGAVNTIYYRRLENGIWTPANDILVTAEGGPLLISSVAVDEQDYLNILWLDLGRTRSLYFSRAHTSLAENPWAWTTILLDIPFTATIAPTLAAAGPGRLIAVYAADNRNILFLLSQDYGKTWTAPATIYTIADITNASVTNPRLAVDERGGIHVVWTENVSVRNWQGEAVYYAHSFDDGLTWDIREIYRSGPEERTTAWINVAIRNDSEVHLVWNRGIGSLDGRYHTWSADYGETWTDPVSFFPPNESGQTHWPWMVVDSAGVLHLISKTGSGVRDGTPKYMYWDGSRWSPMYIFGETQNDLDSALAIGLGNQLHFVHADETGGGRLLYTTRTTLAPLIPAEPIFPPNSDLALTPTPQSISTVAPATLEANFQNTIVPTDTTSSTSFLPLLFAITTVSLLLLIILVYRFFRANR